MASKARAAASATTPAATTPSLTRDEFLAAQPSYLGLGIRDDASFAEEAGTLTIAYRWEGVDIYRVEWDPSFASRPWTIMQLPRVGRGPWASIATGPTFDEAAKVLIGLVIRFPAMREESFAARLEERIAPARLVIPQGGPDLTSLPALGMTAVLLLTHDPIDVPEIERSPITRAWIPLNAFERDGACVDIFEQGQAAKRVPVRLHEWVCPAIDAPAVVRQLVDAGHPDGVLPLMVVLGPSVTEYAIPIHLTKTADIVVRSGRAVGATIDDNVRREAARAITEGRLPGELE